MEVQGSEVTASPPELKKVYDGLTTLKVTTLAPWVYAVGINRPAKRNAMNLPFWPEMRALFAALDVDPEVRVIVIYGVGKIFTSGLDLMAFASIGQTESNDVGRKFFKNLQVVPAMQDSFTAIERCSKPVIAAVHGACVGGGLDLITACDIRLCSAEVWFQVKEVDVGLAADVGTLQRLPKAIGNMSKVNEWSMTARKIQSGEAKQSGLVSDVFSGPQEVMAAAKEMAVTIAGKSPVAVMGTKHNIVYSRDHPVDDSLKHMVIWNSAMLQSEDLPKAAQAAMSRQTATYSKL